MEWESVITNAREAGRSALTEAEAKQLLGHFGVPVVDEKVAGSGAEAADVAERMGFPVVVKGLGAKLTHKTERGLVRLGVGDRQQVLEAARAIAAEAGAELEGFLVQPMLAGRREFVAGLIRDPQFGPVVMFGLGGIFTEALKDVTFRIAPVSEDEAARMLDELKSSALLGGFRGEAPVDRAALVGALTGLSRLGLQCPQVEEVDINPLLADARGRVAAVDALVVLGDGVARELPAGEKPAEERDLSFLDRMFLPRSIAVTGVPREMPPGWPGLFGCMQDFGYPGRLYPINPKADEINGVKAYPSLAALPEKVDLVLVSVPAPFVPANLRECIATGHRDIHIFSAGFKETGEEEGIRLQQEIEQIAVEGGLNVIGPNCMGLYVPKSRITTWTSAEDNAGPVAFVSQSGGHAQDLTHYANQFNIGFSKVISYGNALTLDSTDFLAYLRNDEETQVICMYLEGVKDGQKLARLVTEINRT
jgi:acyl-CoA synthetase (NDP forming)